MSHPVKVSVQVDGGLVLADYNRLTLSQHVLTHHAFALDFSFEALAKALGLKVDSLFAQAHERLAGKILTINWVGALESDAGRSFEFKGLITNLSIQTDSDLVNYYHISGYSPTFLLEDGTQSRTFVKKSLQAICEQVLSDYPANPLQQQLKAQRKDVLPYTVQFHETNFNFLSRLAAAQGEWFYYDGTILHLGWQAGSTIAFKSNSAQVFTLSMQLQPGKTEGAYYNYRTHQALKTTAAAPSGGHPFSQFAVQKSDEVFAQTNRLYAGAQVSDQGQLQRTLDGLSSRRAGNQVSLEGQGELFETRPGTVLDVQDDAGANYGKFRVLSVRHEIDGDGNYQNHFEAMPDAAPAPPANGLYVATDAQPELAEVIDVDDPRRLGRIRVRYFWPVKQPTSAESAWLRVSTPYSGDGKGQLFTPEVGSQVLVGYEHGMAEFPVVLGNLFHVQNKQGAKYTNPQNNMKGLQTAGGNKFVMGDTAGQQHILISNSNNKGTAIAVGFNGDGSVSITTNGPISLTAGGDITLTAKKNITLTATEDIKLSGKNVAVEAKENIDKKAKKIAATGSDNLDLKGKATTLKADDTMQIAATSSLDVNGGSKASISSGRTRIH